jgi:hypothetical protein
MARRLRHACARQKLKIGYDVPGPAVWDRELTGNCMMRHPGSVPADYDGQSFTYAGRSRQLYVRGSGPGVIVLHEIPGITPLVFRFADWLVDAGLRVYLPELVGVAGKQPSIAYVARSIATICISREFAVLAANRSSPLADWLRALVRHAHREAGGTGVGAVGTCFSGNFVLAMMLEPGAPVLSQPSLPFAIGARRKRALHLSPSEWSCVQGRCAAGARLLALQLQLRGDREALYLLLLRGDAGIDHGLLSGGIGGRDRFCGLRHMFSAT